MKLVRSILAALIVLSLSACAGSQLSVATHDDLKAAAAYAEANGFPARAAVWTAVDAQLAACENAIAAAKPAPLPSAPVGIFTLAEMTAEGIASFNAGLSPQIQANCAPLPLINFPVIIKP